MIVTEFYDGQGLGNQLWAYVACRSIAEKLQLQHTILYPERFKGRSFLDIDIGRKEPLLTGGKERTQVNAVFHERVFYDRDLDYIASDFDENVLSLKPFTKIDGIFQSEDYLFGNPSLSKKYIAIKEEFQKNRLIDGSCCVMNVRGGEYKRHRKLILPISYWENAMNNMRDLFGIDRFLVVTDDRRYAKALFPQLPVIHRGIAECYVALFQAKYLILSNSSFSYFPVKTAADKSFVIAPMHWSRFGNKYSRWASPANLYDSWMWQDVNGLLHSHIDCLEGRAHTRKYYRNHYYVWTSPSAVMNSGIRGYLPGWLKKPIKKGLSLLFPKRIGQ